MRTQTKSDLVTDRLILLGWHPLPPAVFSKIETDFQRAVAEAEVKLAGEIDPQTIIKASRYIAAQARQTVNSGTKSEQVGASS